MTKSLTEQWREGTLPDDTYYWKVCKENWIADKYEMYDYTKVYDVNKIECLAPVPSFAEYSLLMLRNKDVDKAIYEENYKLKKQLAIATKALKRIDPPNINFEDYNNRAIALWEIAHKALKEIEEVK